MFSMRDTAYFPLWSSVYRGGDRRW